MVGLYQTLAIRQNHLALLHCLLRRQAAVGLAQTHRTTGQHGAHAQLAHALDLNINGVFQAVRE